MRFIVVGRARNRDACQCNYYVTGSGCMAATYHKAYIFRSLKDAQEDADFHNRGNERYKFHVEQLPPRMRISLAVLHSTPVGN